MVRTRRAFERGKTDQNDVQEECRSDRGGLYLRGLVGIEKTCHAKSQELVDANEKRMKIYQWRGDRVLSEENLFQLHGPCNKFQKSACVCAYASAGLLSFSFSVQIGSAPWWDFLSIISKYIQKSCF